MSPSQRTLEAFVLNGEDSDERTETKSAQSGKCTSSYSERTLYEAMSSRHSPTTESGGLLVDIASAPSSQIMEATSTSMLTLQNLEKHNKEADRLQKEHSINARTRQQDFDDLKEVLKSLGVDLSDETIDGMMPISAGATILKRFVLDKQDRTLEVKLYEKNASKVKDHNHAVSMSDLEELLADFQH